MAHKSSFIDAWTGNESGSQFGMACGKSCIAYVETGRECSKHSKIPALMSSPAGAVTLEFTCFHVDKRYILGADLTSTWVDMFADGGEVGFAFALHGGTFAVSRYSLSGAIEAMAAVTKHLRTDDGKALRDFTI